MSDVPLEQRDCGWLAPLGWAAYLASSWTWCIGMFLPVLLVRDFGSGAFVVFAAPNVLGAAAMGWVLRRREDSDSVVRAHRPALVCFSVVTIAFQAYFALIILGKWSDYFYELHALPLMLLAIATAAGFLRGGRRAAAIACLCSLVLFLAYLRAAHWAPVSRWPAPGLVDVRIPQRDASLVWLAPVTCFGFLLCPYLDLTFHRARSALDARPARLAFGFGFGVLFLAMILFTLAYSGEFFDRPLTTDRRTLAIVLVHIVLQLGITMGLHASAVAASPRSVWKRAGLIAIVAILAAMIIFGLPPDGKLRGGATMAVKTSWEDGYRLFMAFYGLVFPAYVWLCMIPARGETTQRPSRSKLRVFAAAVTLAAPCYWLGFIERETWWLGPGLFIVLAARLLVRPEAAPRTG